jgi:cysteine desulfurase/selenocysteine lyase
VDAAQSAARLRLNVHALGADFLAFSGHKVYGPTGIGVLWARRELLETMPPWQGGGEMIERVELEGSTFKPSPLRFEAGTPNIAGAVGLAAAMAFLESLGLDAVREHDAQLVDRTLRRLADDVPGIRLYGPPAGGGAHLGAVSFRLHDRHGHEIHPHDVATIVDAEGVAIRAGHHCNQPLMKRLGVSATARASFAVHNGEDDVDALVGALLSARGLFGGG